MGEFGEITREIKNEKRGKLYCRMVERKDKKDDSRSTACRQNH